MGSKCSKCAPQAKTSSKNPNTSLNDLPNTQENPIKDPILHISIDNSLLTLDKILHKYPDNPEILISFANHLYEKSLFSSSLECFSQLIEQGYQLSAKDSLIYSHILIQGKNFALALKVLTQSLENSPNNHEIHALLAEIYTSLDVPEQVFLHISEALRLGDDVAEYHNSFGLCKMKDKAYPEALKHFLRAFDLDSNMAKALNNAGNAYRKLGNTDEAIKCYNQAINLVPKRKFPIALINLATACFYTGNMLLTLQYFEEALQTGCNIHKDMVKKGYHLLFKNPRTKHAIELVYKQDYTKSLNILGEVLKTDPQNPIVNFYIALVLEKSGRYAEASEYYKTTIESGVKPINLGKQFIRHYVKRAGKALDRQVPKKICKTCEEIPEADEDSENSTINIGSVQAFKVRAESLSKPYNPRSQETPDSPLDTSIEEPLEKCQII